MASHTSRELIFNQKFRTMRKGRPEHGGAELNWDGVRRYNLVEQWSQDHHKTILSIIIANSLVIITIFTGKQLSLVFSDWYKMWHVSLVRPLCLQTGHTQRVWPSSSLPPPHFYYVFVIRHFAFFLVPSPLQELNNYNSLLRYFILALINKSAILRGQNLSQQRLVWFRFLAAL